MALTFLDEVGNNSTGLIDLSRTKQNIDLSTLDAMYASQLYLDHPNSEYKARGDQSSSSPKTPGMHGIEMVREFDTACHLTSS